MSQLDKNLSLADGLRLSAMSFEQLWIRYLSVGGLAGALEIEAYVLGVLSLDSYEHNLIAQAINEHFLDAGGDHPVGYWKVTT